MAERKPLYDNTAARDQSWAVKKIAKMNEGNGNAHAPEYEGRGGGTRRDTIKNYNIRGNVWMAQIFGDVI